jgi:hypothetical protein
MNDLREEYLKNRLILFFFVAASCMCGCASSSLDSYVNPAFKGMRFTKILVVADIEDPEWKRKIEKTFAEAFAQEMITAKTVFNSSLVEMASSDSVRARILRENNCDACLIVGRESDGRSEASTLTAITKLPEEHGMDWLSYHQYPPIIPNPVSGQRYERTWFEFGGYLFDGATDSLVWRASSHREISAYGNLDLAVTANCRKIVVQLVKDGCVGSAALVPGRE